MTGPPGRLLFWDDAPEILAGQDLKAGGTWMGITKKGRFAAITNYREAGLTTRGSPFPGRSGKGLFDG